MSIENDIFESIAAKAWPFKEMNIGDIEIFETNQLAAQRTAHAYGRNYGMKFKTATDKSTGKLYVKRVS